jgi:hypothetical protein
VDIAIGALMAWLVIIVMSALAAVAFYTLAVDTLAVDTVQDALALDEDMVGQPTVDVIERLGSSSYTCTDGRKLHWNDTGWGWEDETWEAHARDDGQLVPPQDVLDAC